MRMWGVEPEILCRQHLLGEHVEMHMFVGHLNAGRHLGAYAKGLVARHEIRNRHDLLVAEMQRRGMNHRSPLPSFNERREGFVNVPRSLADLLKRCPLCRARAEEMERENRP